MIEKFFDNSNINFNKLIEYGFKHSGFCYLLQKSILNNQFTLNVFIDENNIVSTKIIDKSTNEEYVLHLIEGVNGEFVNNVRSEYFKILTDIKNKCCETQIFNFFQSQQVIDYIKNKYNDELEFLWPKFPNNAIWRRKDNQKWYALIVSLRKNKLNLKGDELIEIINVRTSENN